MTTSVPALTEPAIVDAEFIEVVTALPVQADGDHRWSTYGSVGTRAARPAGSTVRRLSDSSAMSVGRSAT